MRGEEIRKNFIEFFKKFLGFLKYIFFGKDLKSDLLFLGLVFAFYIAMKLTFPYFLSVVMSPSMEHTNFNYEKYLRYNITEEEIKNWPFGEGINKGDVVIIFPVKDPLKDIKEGDVVLYMGVDGKPIMHRVIKIINTSNNICFVIMGDNNPAPIYYQREDCMPPDRIIGKVVFRIPYLGMPKVLLTELISKIYLQMSQL